MENLYRTAQRGPPRQIWFDQAATPSVWCSSGWSLLTFTSLLSCSILFFLPQWDLCFPFGAFQVLFISCVLIYGPPLEIYSSQHCYHHRLLRLMRCKSNSCISSNSVQDRAPSYISCQQFHHWFSIFTFSIFSLAFYIPSSYWSTVWERSFWSLRSKLRSATSRISFL